MGSITRMKRQIIEQLLSEEDFILMVVLPTFEGVKLPDDLMQAGDPVGINIGMNMAIPVPDLEITEEGISATLSFNRTPFHCAFPWPAVVQVSADLEHLIWVEPPADGGEVDAGDAPEPEPEPDRPHLKLV